MNILSHVTYYALYKQMETILIKVRPNYCSIYAYFSDLARNLSHTYCSPSFCGVFLNTAHLCQQSHMLRSSKHNAMFVYNRRWFTRPYRPGIKPINGRLRDDISLPNCSLPAGNSRRRAWCDCMFGSCWQDFNNLE